MLIPPEKLHPDTLRAIVEEFVLREGTDYGMVEHSLRSKVDQVLMQIKLGQVVIFFDEISETCTILNNEEVKK